MQPILHKRVLLAHLVSNGDCLYATTVARQIKTDNPQCHLTWAVSARCRSIVENNPDVDSIWELTPKDSEDAVQMWRRFSEEAKGRLLAGDFDIAHFTQFSPDYLERWRGTIRSTILSGYPRPITVSPKPTLQLRNDEVERVEQFAKQHQLTEASNVILFECAPASGQSVVTPEIALQVARRLTGVFPDLKIILSSDRAACISPAEAAQLIDGSGLTLRENAELTKYCSFLVGCSSGISWISTSTWARKLSMIQLLRSKTMWNNSMVHDHEVQQLPTGHLLELFDPDTQTIVSCISAVLESDFNAARAQFHQVYADRLVTYRQLLRDLLRQRKLPKAAELFRNNWRQILRQPLTLMWHGWAVVYYLFIVSRTAR